MTFYFCISSATSNNIDEKELAYVTDIELQEFLFSSRKTIGMKFSLGILSEQA
jgi:hypothetical protein